MLCILRELLFQKLCHSNLITMFLKLNKEMLLATGQFAPNFFHGYSKNTLHNPQILSHKQECKEKNQLFLRT